MVSKKKIGMKTLQKFGGFAALYLAAAYLIGMVLFLAVLDYPSVTDPAQKVALLVGNCAAAQQSGDDSRKSRMGSRIKVNQKWRKR
jgi:hypothetical protein